MWLTLFACTAEPELKAEDAYEWTQGRVVFADRKRRDAASSTITTSDGQEFQPSKSTLRRRPEAVGPDGMIFITHCGCHEVGFRVGQSMYMFFFGY